MIGWFGIAAAAPPEGVVAEDIARWEAGSAALLAGPRGCWVLRGQVALTGASYSPASRWGRGGRDDAKFVGGFVGRLEDGRWTEFAYDLSPADAPGTPAPVSFPMFPTVGRIDPATARRTNPPPEEEGLVVATGDTEATNLLNQVLDELSPATTTAIAEWDDGGRAIRLIADVPVSDRADAEVVTVTTRFPEGGPATSLDAVFPRRMRLGEVPIRIAVYDAQVHLRAQRVGEDVLPALDSLSFGVGALGFTVAYEQKLVFEHASRCPAE